MPHEAYPWFSRENNKLIVALRQSNEPLRKFISIRLVLDFNGFGDVMGFEIINLKYFAGTKILNNLDFESLTSSGMKCSYNEETDVFYLRLPDDPLYVLVSSGNVLDQRSVDGKLFLDSEERLVRIEAEY